MKKITPVQRALMKKKLNWISLGRRRLPCPRCHTKFDVEGREDGRIAISYKGKRKELHRKKSARIIKDTMPMKTIRCPNPNCRVILGVSGDLRTGYLELSYERRSE